MKRVISLLCLMMLLFGGSKTFAYSNRCCPQDCFDWCELDFSVHADYLYWDVTRPDNFLVSEFGVGDIILFSVPEYQSGYRVGASVGMNCWDFSIRYTSLDAKANKSRSDLGGSFDELGSIAYDLDFNTVDLAIGYIYNFQCFNGFITPFIGAKLAWLKDKTHLIEQNNRLKTRELTTDAYGLMFGFEGSWQIFNCCIPISLVARGDISILSGTMKFAEPLNQGTFDDPEVRCPANSYLSVQDFYIGLGFDFCSFDCFAFDVQVGYEAQVWHGLMNYTDIQLQSSSGNNELGLGGLVVHFNLEF